MPLHVQGTVSESILIFRAGDIVQDYVTSTPAKVCTVPCYSICAKSTIKFCDSKLHVINEFEGQI